MELPLSSHVMELPLSVGLMSNYLYRQYSSNTLSMLPLYSCHGTTSINTHVMELLMSWNYLYRQYSCHGTTSISNTHVMELPLSAILMSWN